MHRVPFLNVMMICRVSRFCLGCWLLDVVWWMFGVGCSLSFFTSTNSIPHFGHLPGWSCTTSGCITQVYRVASGFGVCAISADVMVATKIRVRKNLIIVGDAEYLRRFFSGGGFRLVGPCLSSAAVAAGAAPAATTAISAWRRRGRCANHDQGGNNH